MRLALITAAVVAVMAPPVAAQTLPTLAVGPADRPAPGPIIGTNAVGWFVTSPATDAVAYLQPDGSTAVQRSDAAPASHHDTNCTPSGISVDAVALSCGNEIRARRLSDDALLPVPVTDPGAMFVRGAFAIGARWVRVVVANGTVHAQAWSVLVDRVTGENRSLATHPLRDGQYLDLDRADPVRSDCRPRRPWSFARNRVVNCVTGRQRRVPRQPYRTVNAAYAAWIGDGDTMLMRLGDGRRWRYPGTYGKLSRSALWLSSPRAAGVPFSDVRRVPLPSRTRSAR